MRNRVKNSKKVNEKVLIATVDIGKKSHYGYWRSYTGADCRSFEFSNTRAGFEKFWHTIRTAQDQQKASLIIAGFESTGSYGEPLVHYLRKKPVKLVQVSPMHTKRVKELCDNSPRKADQKDPRVIADIIQLGHYLSLVVPTGAAGELRRLTNARERAVTDRSSTIRRLHALLSVVFPEFVEVMKSVTSKSSLYLLQLVPVPRLIVALGKTRLKNRLYTVSRGRFGEKRAEELYAVAYDSVGVTDGSESISMEIRKLLADIAADTASIVLYESKMKEFLETLPYSRHLLSIKGIGIVTASGIIGEIGSFEAYSSANKLIKLAGLNLFEISSGAHKGIRRITKRGRAKLRKILYFAAINVVRKDGVLHSYYQKLINRGMHRMKALVAVMKKLLRIMFALVRNQTVYNTEYSMKQAA